MLVFKASIFAMCRNAVVTKVVPPVFNLMK
jgi:hypothetical protein